MFLNLGFSAFQFLSFHSIPHALDEIADWGFFVVDEMAGSDAVGGNEDLGVEAGSEEINGDDGSALRFSLKAERLAEQHFAALEGGVRMAADSVADDLGGDHFLVKAEKLGC
jgi:hypothetical protein